jgi:hypothetical protein
MLILVSVAGLASLCLAYYAPKYRQHQRVSRASAIVEEHHARIREGEWVGNTFVARTINFYGRSLTDRELADLAYYPDLTGLELRGSDVTDDGMTALSRFTGLVRLDISRTAVRAAGIEQLRLVPTLSSLTLDARQLRQLATVPRDALPRVKHVWLDDPRIDDRAIAGLDRWENLDSVEVHQGVISDNGLARLGCHTTLTRLVVDNGAGITDAGLRHLRDLKRLQFLFLSGTKATPTAGAKLQESLPHCRIVVSQGAGVFYAGGPQSGADQNGDQE